MFPKEFAQPNPVRGFQLIGFPRIFHNQTPLGVSQGINEMPNTYTQLYIHFVFAVRHRECLISSEWKDKLYQYITGIIRKRNQHVMAIGGVHDHIHIFVSMNPDISLSDLMADVKRASSKWINDNHLTTRHFSWQEGFGAFSYAQSQKETVIRYVLNQENHHLKKTFREEYITTLKKYDIEYDEKYIFDDV